MTSPTWNFDKMLKGLPNLNTVNGVPDQSVSWHMFDISHNYINDRINWTDTVIELKDSKQMFCYSFSYYGEFKAFTPIADIKKFNGGMIDVDGIRAYFNEHAFTQIFNGIGGVEAEIVEMCGLTQETFIVMPMYETARVMYVALLNINKRYGEYLETVYNATSDSYVAKFFNLIDVTHGLQTHTSITGVKQATSFNLFKSLYTTNIAKYTVCTGIESPAKGNATAVTQNSRSRFEMGLEFRVSSGKNGGCTKPGLNYKFDSNKLILNDNCEIPIILLFNGYNYFPRFQVVWSTDKIFLNLPGVTPPTNDSLLRANKVLKVYHDKSDTTVDKIPRVMTQNSNTINTKTKAHAKSKQKTVADWLRDYKKYCGAETTQYTSMTKLLRSMNHLQLETADYTALS
jgi:hypothetical protein